MKRNSTKNANWKSVEVDDLAFKEAATRGLVAIEECTDYNLESFRTVSKRKAEKSGDEPAIKKKKKHTKRVVDNVISPSKHGSSVKIDSAEDDFLAWTRFGLPDVVLRALRDQGFTEPTRIQELTLAAAILGRRDIVGAAETGSGKTLAFGLPIITGILDEKSKNLENQDEALHALILTPTRELAMQIKSHLEAAAKYTDIKIAAIVGGMAVVKQERILRRCPEIVVATPGRLWELVQQGNHHLSKLDYLKYLVIDETDRMLEKGHFEELRDLLERLNQDTSAKKSRQTFVFSATLSLIHDLPKYLYSKHKKIKKQDSQQKLNKIITALNITNPKIVDISDGSGTSKTLSESRITCNHTEKDYYVYYFLQKYPGKTLIFCNSVGCVKRLTNLLGILDCRVLPLHSSKQQKQRLKNLERFRDDQGAILIATDVAARGLDIPKVDHVIHYQTPRTSESYVHRSGRTARASNEGLTVVLSEPAELQSYIKLCRTLNKSEDLPVFPVEDNFLTAVKERVNLARKLDELLLKIRKENTEKGWFQKAAEEMDIIVDDLKIDSDNEDESANIKKHANVMRKQLDSLLKQPVFPRGFNTKYPLSSGDFYIDKSSEKAVDVLKNALEVSVKTKKKNIPLYRPKKNK